MELIKRLQLLLIFFVVLMIAGCNHAISTMNGRTELKSPPTLNVQYQDQSIDAIRGTYTWNFVNDDGTETVIEATSPAPPELVKNSDPLTVPPKSSLSLSFSNEPQDITVYIWPENQAVIQSISDNTIVTPDYEGLIVYEVVGTWTEGTVSYAFSVCVE